MIKVVKRLTDDFLLFGETGIRGEVIGDDASSLASMKWVLRFVLKCMQKRMIGQFAFQYPHNPRKPVDPFKINPTIARISLG